MKTFDAIVAGAGIWGCTVARRLAEAGKRVLVLEKRAAVGGNCRCEIDPETGIEVHTYGSHIFHTSNEEVWAFVRRFTEFNDYRHCVLAKTKKCGRGVEGQSRSRRADGSISDCGVEPCRGGEGEKKIGVENGCTADGLPSPCIDLTQSHRDTEGHREVFEKGEARGLGCNPSSKNLCDSLCPCASVLKSVHSSTSTSYFDSLHTYHLPIGCTLLKEFFGREIKPSEMTDGERTQLFDAFIRGYTSKQWGVAPEKVDSSIIARLKVRDNYSTDYFDDPHQGIPAEGYNKMFERMLDHPNIVVQCNCELVLDGEKVKVRGALGDRALPGNEPSAVHLHLSPSPASCPIYYSGPIDALFNYEYGALPWRTLRFERETLSVADYQGNSVVNYTDAEVPFTRIHEFRHYHPEWAEKKIGVENRRTADGSPSPCVDLTQRHRDTEVHREVFEKDEARGLGCNPSSKNLCDSLYPCASVLKPVRSSTSTSNFDVSSQKTIIMREYSATWQPGDEPYYPIDNADSRALLAKYQEEVERLNSRNQESKSKSGIDAHHSSTSTSHFNLVVGGRLGGYKYFDMDKSIAAALEVKI